MSALTHPLTLTTVIHLIIVCAVGVPVIMPRTESGVEFA